MAEAEMVTLRVALNGTSENPWHRYGLTCNPFPQTGIAELRRGERAIASLDGDPISGADDIRQRLAGFAPGFVEGVVARFRPGERVRFTVTFPRARGVSADE